MNTEEVRSLVSKNGMWEYRITYRTKRTYSTKWISIILCNGHVVSSSSGSSYFRDGRPTKKEMKKTLLDHVIGFHKYMEEDMLLDSSVQKEPDVMQMPKSKITKKAGK